MKKFKITLFLALFFCFTNNTKMFAQEKQKTVFGKTINPNSIHPTTGFVRCISDEYELYLQENDPKRFTNTQFEAWLAPLIEQYKSNQTLSSESGGIITIPVVVHVIHNGDAYGTNENITDEQVQSQITVMNQDFRRMMGTPGFNSNPVGVDTQIQFALAKVDPNGNPTNGINRKNLCQASFSTNQINSSVKPATSWDPSQYMNMWSVNFTDSSLLGFAQFPNASGLQGLNSSGGSANTDGVVAGYAFFGSSAITSGQFQAPFDRGRTMTHEVGHWIGLRHIWGDGGCGVDDFCADTPVAGSPNFGCPNGTDSCPSSPGVDMIQNYMDYTDDLCMNIFTQNQKDRMVVIMNNAPRRLSLKTSTKDLPIPLFANDAELLIEPNCTPSGSSSCTSTLSQRVALYNRGTSNLTSATISYNINGGTSTNFNWTGNLAPNKYAIIDITIANPANGTLNMAISSVNGGNDQRATNNSISTNVAIATSNSIAFNQVNFTLIGDRYGAETTWNLKNAAGTTLFSGGPYTNLTSNTTQNLVNQNWTLNSNDCYTLTVNDSFGDGLCCQYGNGSYSIKSLDGATTVVSGATFTDTESKSFGVNLLSNQQFNGFQDIILYPNPTKNLLNISLPTNFGLPTNYIIHNNLGQTIANKLVLSQNDLSIDTSLYNSGIYFITIQKEAIKTTLRFIKE